MQDLDRDSRFDALLVSTCSDCRTTWIKERVGQRHDCPTVSDEPDSTTSTLEIPQKEF